MFWAREALQANRLAGVAVSLNDVPAYVQGGSAYSHPILQELDELGANGLTALWVQSRRHGAYPQEHYSQCHRLVAGR
jgi:hypothetical protein